MSAVQDVLHRARRHRVRILVSGDRLKLKAPTKPPDDLIADLEKCKSAIMALLVADGIHCPYCGDPLDADELIDATDGYVTARIHQRCVEGWAEATAAAWEARR